MDRQPDIRREVLQQTLDEVNQSAEKEKTSNPCVICLDDVSEKALAIPCQHEHFDFLCLASWLEERTQCPLCKSEVDSVRYEIKSDTDYKVYEVKRVNARLASRPRLARPVQRQRRDRLVRRRIDDRASSPDAAIRRRREVYRQGLFSLHVGSNRISRFQELTPAMFSRDTELVSRARNWIRRELQVFEYLHPANRSESSRDAVRGNNAEFLLEYCIAILKTVNIRDASGQAEDMLQEFLGRQNARLFLHELSSWLRSPYSSLEAWDRHAQYNENPSSATEASHVTSNSTRARPRKRRRGESAFIGSLGDNNHGQRAINRPRRMYDSYRPSN